MAIPTTNCSLSDIADEYSATISYNKPHSFSEYLNQGDSFQTAINNPVHNGIRKLRYINGSPFSVLFFEQNSSWTVPLHVTDIRYVIIGGGGGGAHFQSMMGNGGGGGGGMLDATLSVTPGTQYNFTIGQGGVVGSENAGGDTTAFGLTAWGGGYGAYGASQYSAGGGGSGGGGATIRAWNYTTGGYDNKIVNNGTARGGEGTQGYNGGTGGFNTARFSNPAAGGGGGGAGGRGGSMTTGGYNNWDAYPGNGGPGRSTDIEGPYNVVYYAGGGGGSRMHFDSSESGDGGVGSENAGGGGTVGYDGKNGLVIVRYLLPA